MAAVSSSTISTIKEEIKAPPVVPEYSYSKPSPMGLSEVETKRMMLACSNGDVGQFLDVIERHPMLELNNVLDEGREMTPLMLACENIEAIEMARALVEELGVDVNTKVHERSVTALHVACRSGNDAAAQLLIDAGADIFARDLCGRLPIHFACMSCGLRTVRSFLRRGGASMVDTKDGSGYTPLMTAAEYGKHEAVLFLTRCKADKLEGNRLMHTAIELADWYGHNLIVKALDPAAIPSTEWPGGAGPLSIANITAAAHAHGKKLPPGFAGSGQAGAPADGAAAGNTGEQEGGAKEGGGEGGGKGADSGSGAKGGEGGDASGGPGGGTGGPGGSGSGAAPMES